MLSRVELYGVALRRQAQLQKALGAVTTGVFLGLMDREHLARIDQAHYDDATETVDGTPRRYADEHMVRSGLFGWEERAVTEHFPAGGTVAVMAAGAGREVLALLEAGYDAHGHEPHPVLAAQGSELLESAGYVGRLHPSGRDGFPEGGQVDAAVVGWGAYGLVPRRQTRVALLRGARARLAPGAPLLVSYMARPAESRYLDLVHRTARPLRRLRGAPPPEPGDCLLPNFVHYFTAAELRGELAAGGFETLVQGSEPYGHAIGVAV